MTCSYLLLVVSQGNFQYLHSRPKYRKPVGCFSPDCGYCQILRLCKWTKQELNRDLGLTQHCCCERPPCLVATFEWWVYKSFYLTVTVCERFCWLQTVRNTKSTEWQLFWTFRKWKGFHLGRGYNSFPGPHTCLQFSCNLAWNWYRRDVSVDLAAAFLETSVLRIVFVLLAANQFLGPPQTPKHLCNWRESIFKLLSDYKYWREFISIYITRFPLNFCCLKIVRIKQNKNKIKLGRRRVVQFWYDTTILNLVQGS